MDYLNIYANGKINIALDVVGKRDDGYHNLRTIMQTVSLKDTLTIRKIFTPQIKLCSNLKWLPTDERNLVYKAAKALFDRFEPDYGVFIEINKQIPVSAGLGGGSADCAAALCGISKMFNFPISRQELMELGAKLGADVPFCIMKGTALAEGIGDVLTPLSPCPDIFIVIAKPPICISTADVFRQYKAENVESRPDIDKMIKDIEAGDIKAVASGLCNVLESVTAKEFCIIDKIKEIMYDHSSIGAVMSGSGPSVYGMFEDKQNAYNALMQIKSDLSIKEVHLTNIFTPGRKE
ncbi:4-(cytidine 5'-diphospho)-2-C-methyl-D-erythritol kinase [Tyzzerella sp. OttesenSCG-928-J15]|nr:4-(cytidine 5'-diphospho)-2-C-methyl-D-erythritol kinase [Tyzzerella sp. OttesenSCG-928-J15]